MDDGEGGDFTTIFTTQQQNTFTVTEGIERGKNYRFRYRVSNINGWSDYSDVSYISAFSIPEAPPAPIFDDANSTTITLILSPSTDDNGSRIKGYELWIDEGDDLLSDFDQVMTYPSTGFAPTHILD
jgi:hypothetical protein